MITSENQFVFLLRMSTIVTIYFWGINVDYWAEISTTKICNWTFDWADIHVKFSISSNNTTNIWMYIVIHKYVYANWFHGDR